MSLYLLFKSFNSKIDREVKLENNEFISWKFMFVLNWKSFILWFDSCSLFNKALFDFQILFAILIFSADIFWIKLKSWSNWTISTLFKKFPLKSSAFIILVIPSFASLIQIPFSVITAKYLLSFAYEFLIFK